MIARRLGPCPLAAVAALLAVSTGCSLVMKGAPDPPIALDQEVHCTSDATAPVVDGVIAVAATTVGIVWVAGNAGKTCSEEPCGAKIATGLGTALIAGGLLYGIASAYGFGKARRCREVIESQVGCRDGDLAACQKLQPHPAPPVESSPSSGTEEP